MKKFKKALACMLLGAVACTSVAFTGCGGGGGTTDGGSGDGQYDVDPGVFENKTPFELKVWNFGGGYGDTWLRAVAKRYTDARMDKKFTVNGKEYDSVKVKIESVKQIMSQQEINFAPTNHVYFQEAVSYTTYVRERRILEDMTEALTTPNPYENGKTLEDKLSAEQKQFYNVNGKYYGIPHYAGYVGITYNKKMFTDKGLYLADDYEWDGTAGTLLDCFIGNDDTVEKTAGPDGKKGTDDDGLPTTYEEFFMLCQLIKQIGGKNMLPIEWSGQNRGKYLNWFLASLEANYAGLEQASLNFSGEGTAKNLISVDDNGNVTALPDVQINGDNYAELSKQAGKYYALKFLEEIMGGGYYDDQWNNTSHTQTAAQDDFIKGDSSGKKPAMLIDGCWWKMEANATITTMVQMGKDVRNDFGWMPLPCATQEQADERAAKLAAGQHGYTLQDTHNSLCFIGKGISEDERKLAIDFVQFAYTDESLVEFSKITDTTKAVIYTMSDEDKAGMTYYGRSLMDIQEHADVVYGTSRSQYFNNHEVSLIDYDNMYNSKVSGGTVSKIAVDVFTGNNKKTAKQYFDGLYEYRRSL